MTDLITLRKPTKPSEVLFLSHLEHLLVHELNQNLDALLKPEIPADKAYNHGMLEQRAIRYLACLDAIPVESTPTEEQIKALRAAAEDLQTPDELKRLQALSVTHVLLDVVPGDGSGHEVFATSVNDVVEKLTEMGTRIEDLERSLRNKPEIDSNALWAKFLDLVQADAFKGTPKEKCLPLVNLMGSTCRFEILFKEAAKQVNAGMHPDTARLVTLGSLTGSWPLDLQTEHDDQIKAEFPTGPKTLEEVRRALDIAAGSVK